MYNMPKLVILRYIITTKSPATGEVLYYTRFGNFESRDMIESHPYLLQIFNTNIGAKRVCTRYSKYINNDIRLNIREVVYKAEI